MGGARRGARCGLRRYSLGMRHHHRTTADIEQDARGLLCGSGRRRGAVILCCAGAGAPHAPLPRCVVVVTRVLLPPPQLRGSSLAGARILFSGVFPRDVAPAVVREMPLYRAALGCGARIVDDYSGAGPTHVVARFGGTEKVHQVCARWHTRVFGAAPWQMQHARTRTARARAQAKARRVCIVGMKWLEDCWSSWARADEALYAVPGFEGCAVPPVLVPELPPPPPAPPAAADAAAAGAAAADDDDAPSAHDADADDLGRWLAGGGGGGGADDSDDASAGGAADDAEEQPHKRARVDGDT